MPASGSRPLYYQSTNMPAKVTRGRKTLGFPAKNQKNLVSALGSFRMSFGIYTSIVSPPRMGRGLLVSNCACEPSTVAVASRCRSEERRVGKECRSRRSRYHKKKNKVEMK